MSAIPHPERVDYVLQRHVTHSLPGPGAGFRRRFERAAAPRLRLRGASWDPSTSTLAHIPERELVPLLAECRRAPAATGGRELADRPERPLLALRRLGLAVQLPSLFGAQMGLVDSELLHQNRLRRCDYVSAFERAGFTVVAERPWRPNIPLPDDLDPRFRGYDSDNLAVVRLRIVAVPSPDALVEPEDLVD